MSVKESKLQRALPVLLCGVGLLFFFYPELLSGFRRMQWDIGDTRLLNLVLEQTYAWVKGGALWDPPYFYPALNVAGYTDLFLGPAPLYWALRAPGLAMDTAMQVFMIAVVGLNYWAAYLWLRRPLRFGVFGAAAGAFLFAFGYPRGVQLGHPALVPQFPTCLALYGLWRCFSPAPPLSLGEPPVAAPGARGRWLWSTTETGVVCFFAGIALQLLTGFYLGWFLVLGLGLAALGALLFSERRRALWRFARAHALLTAVAATAAAASVASMAIHYLAAAREVGMRPFSAVFPPRIQAWFYLGHESWLYSWQDLLKGFRMLDYGPEQKIGIGFVTTVFVLLGWRRIWRETKPGSALRLLGFVSLALFFLCTEFWPGFKPWRLVYEIVPGAKAIRALSRIGIVLLIPEAVGLAAFCDGFLALAKNRRRMILAAGLALAVVVAEQAHRAESFDKMELRDEVADIRESLDPSCRFFYYSPWVDGKEAEYRYQLDAMWVAYQTGIPTLNGYSGNSPPQWGLFGSMLQTPADSVRLGGALASWMQGHGLELSGLCWLEPDLRSKEDRAK